MNRFEFSPEVPLVAMTTMDIDARRAALARDIRESGHAVVALACAGIAGVLALFFARLAGSLAFAGQEVIAFSVFSVGTLIMYQRAELRIRSSEFATVDLSDRGEVRALLNGIPEGRDYWQAVQREGRAFVGRELDQIRARSAYLQALPGAADRLDAQAQDEAAGEATGALALRLA